MSVDWEFSDVICDHLYATNHAVEIRKNCNDRDRENGEKYGDKLKRKWFLVIARSLHKNVR